MNPDVLAARYAKECTDPASDIHEHLPTFYNAVIEMGAQRIIELGVRFGNSTLAWMKALHDQGSGHLWAVDVSWPIELIDGTVRTNNLDPQGPLGVVPYWTFILGYDTDAHVLEMLPKDVDIVFIDTNHVYSETLVELELYYPRVRPGGRIFLHDTALEYTGNDPDNPVKYPVRTAVEEFCAARDLEWTNNENCYGLGTIYC